MARTAVTLHCALVPATVAEAVRNSIDEEHRTLFSLSGYQGSRPFLGEVGETTFRVQKRKLYSNGFAGQFYARFEAAPGGTRINGYFDSPRWARLFMNVWLVAAALLGVPAFVQTTINTFAGSHSSIGENWVGLVVPPSLITFGILSSSLGDYWAGRTRRLS